MDQQLHADIENAVLSAFSEHVNSDDRLPLTSRLDSFGLDSLDQMMIIFDVEKDLKQRGYSVDSKAMEKSMLDRVVTLGDLCVRIAGCTASDAVPETNGQQG